MYHKNCARTTFWANFQEPLEKQKKARDIKPEEKSLRHTPYLAKLDGLGRKSE